MQAGLPDLVSMSREHLDGAVALSRAEGWPHRDEDWALVLSGSQGVAALSGGRVVATAIATPFGPGATLNMVLVDQGLRGRGLGRQIIERTMAQISPTHWRLVATTDGLPLYRKLGFEPLGEVRQHQGTARAASAGLPKAVWATPADAPRLAALDRAATAMDRSWLVDALLRAGRVLIQREGDDVVGYAALRRFGLGEVAGPVVARTEAQAQAMMATLLTWCAGRFLRVDLPPGGELAAFLAAHGLSSVGSGIAMVRGQPGPASRSRRVFALASQALG